MRIRSKLVLIIVGIYAALGAAGAWYAGSMSRIERVAAEGRNLVLLSDAVKEQMFAVDRLPICSIKIGSGELAEAGKAAGEAYSALVASERLKRLGEEVTETMEIVADLQALNGARLEKLLRDYEELKVAAKAVFFFVEEMQPIQLLTYDFTPEKRAAALGAVPQLKALLTDIDVVHSSYAMLVDLLAEKSAVVEELLAENRSRTTAIALAGAAFILAAAFVLAVILANSIARSVVGVATSFSRLKGGDLTGRAVRASRDEIGDLADDFNAIIEGFSASIGNIKSVSASNVAAKNELAGAADEASGAGVEIEASARSIERQVVAVSESAEGMAGSIGKITDSISEIRAQVRDEGAMIERTTASIQQVHASLEGMERITARERYSAQELVDESSKGARVFAEASDRIAEILGSIGSIGDLAAVIQDIATRTNLLAMNAAIEAAHAGRYGGGFAVVAEEIRKLSEASTKSSKEIDSSIKAIVGQLAGATDANGEIRKVFSAIIERIGAVASSLEELFAGIGETKKGSDDILDATRALVDHSGKLNAGADSISEVAAAMRSSMEGLSRISGEVASNISEITAGIADIHASIKRVAELAQRVGAESARLDEDVGRFRTEAGEDAGASAAGAEGGAAPLGSPRPA